MISDVHTPEGHPPAEDNSSAEPKGASPAPVASVPPEHAPEPAGSLAGTLPSDASQAEAEPSAPVASVPPEHAPEPAGSLAGTLPSDASQAEAEHEHDISFAQMLAEHEREEEPQLRLAPGQRASVRIVAITEDTIFVSTGSKVDGIVDREEMEVDGELPCKVGDLLDLYVVTANAQEVKLSRILRGAGSLTALEEARDAGLPVEGKITGQVKGGYAVDIMKRRAFCPFSQIDLRPLDDPESAVGKSYPFLITRLEKSGRNIVVSRRALLEREQAENREALLAEIHEGDVREAMVSRLAPFGAFVELAPGVEGLVHLSELSWTRVGQADEVVSVGDKVRVKIMKIGKDDKNARVSLSMKQVMDDPWKNVAERLSVGEVVSGKVVRNAPFGAFVEVLPGVEGLVHLSELSYARRVMKPEEIVVPGDTVAVMIKEMEPEKRRISLSMRDVDGNPWDSAEELLAVDGELTGTVEKRAPFGLFITLSPGITGLMPTSVIQASPSRKRLESLHPGEAIAVRVKEIDTQNRRISLAPAGEESAGAAVEKDWKRHAPKPAPAPSMGALGLALQKALQNKK